MPLMAYSAAVTAVYTTLALILGFAGTALLLIAIAMLLVPAAISDARRARHRDRS